MNLADWVKLIKSTIGAIDFESIATEFLREYYAATVLASDGTGDGGVDAWVVLTSEPPIRLPAQFHSGNSVPWERKLIATAKLLRTQGNPFNLTKLLFVCTQTPSASKVEELNAEIQREFGFSVQVFDARAIASLAMDRRGHLLHLLAQRLPGLEPSSRRALPNARDELLLSFAFFHEQPETYRMEVVKSAIATILHRNKGGIPRTTLLAEVEKLLGLTSLKLPERALRNLEREQKVIASHDSVTAAPSLAERTATAMALAGADEAELRRQCVGALEQFLAKGTHNRVARAERAVEAVFSDLGLLVRNSVAERTLGAVDHHAWRIGRSDAEIAQRWQGLEHRLASELELNHHTLTQAFSTLVRVVAESPFAKSIAAAELFLRITEYEAHELTTALETTISPHIILDASIAMPMLCARFDRPAPDWPTSVAADSLYESLQRRGAQFIIPSLYVEEIAYHLRKARAFEGIIATEPELERSGNFFVAHFCSTRPPGETRSTDHFREFLTAFGAPHAPTGSQMDLRRSEYALTQIFDRYGIDVEDVVERADDPKLPDEPLRDSRLLDHDRAVVRWLTALGGRQPLFCTADRWLQGVLSESSVIALDSAALTDLFELVRPSEEPHRLLTPLAIAHALTEEDRVRAAAVWDAIVAIDSVRLADWKLIHRAREFRAQWLASKRDLSQLSSEWIAFRDAGMDAP